MTSEQGPRRLVLKHLESRKPSVKRNIVSSSGEGVSINTIKVHSSSVPALEYGATFTAGFTQSVTWDGGSAQIPTSNQSFKIAPSSAKLDSSLVHSVYPPPGHSDYWNVLPHVLFNNPQIPWMMNNFPHTDQRSADPWFGLLVFTHDELYVPSQALAEVATASSPTQSPNLSVTLTDAEFSTWTKQKTNGFVDPIDAIFISPVLFQAIFKNPKTESPTSQDPSRFQYLTHVRTVNTSGMANMLGDENGTYSITISARPGPRNITVPTVVYAHLVALPPDAGSSQAELSMCGLRSLYSWQYTCLPYTNYSVAKAFQNLGSSIQPLRNPDTTVKRSTDPKDAWVQRRMLAGYSLARYRPQTGETTICLFRGPLIPNNPFNIDLSSRDLPPSDVGSDLAILDREVGLLDLSFQLAWNLGRTLAISDRTFSAAWLRLRMIVHNSALNDAKIAVDKAQTTRPSRSVENPTQRVSQPAFHPILETMSNLNRSFGQVQKSSLPGQTPADGSQLAPRWIKSETSLGTRALCSLVNPDMKTAYSNSLAPAGSNVACCSDAPKGLRARRNLDITPDSLPIYDETNIPASTDYTIVLKWIMDKWFLQGIPMYNLIPDPVFIPKESIRTFYIDPTWFKAFVDGALSIGDHFTSEDDARETIKSNLTTYLATSVGNKKPPQIPRWGFFLRSDLVQKYPDLRITAPWYSDGSSDPDYLDIIRSERIDDDLLIVLFDRIPGPNGNLFQIKIQPPEHQLCFMIGTTDGWTISESGVYNLTVDWKTVTFNGTEQKPSVQIKSYAGVDSSIFDFGNNVVNPYGVASEAQAVLGNSSLSAAALLGTQLVAAFPQLVIKGGATANRQRDVSSIKNSLSTTRPRLSGGRNNVRTVAPPRVDGNGNIISGPVTPHLSASPLPTYAMAGVEFRNLEILANGGKLSPSETRSWMYTGIDGDGFGSDNMLTVAPAKSSTGVTPKLNIRIWNVYGRMDGKNCYNTYAVSSPYTVRNDLNVTITPREPNLANGWRLKSVEMKFPVYTGVVAQNGSLFNAFLQATEVNKATGGVPRASQPQDFQHRADFVRVKLPQVRSVGMGNRWLLTKAYDSRSQDAQFVVTAKPNAIGMTSYDINDRYELAFVIEDVSIYWTLPGPTGTKGPRLRSNKVTLTVIEHYESTPVSPSGMDVTGYTLTKIAALDMKQAYSPMYEQALPFQGPIR